MPVTVSVQNFGPIREAEIELKPLMVLVGTNNTGKTYFATVIQRVLEAHTRPGHASDRRLADRLSEILDRMALERGARDDPEDEAATVGTPALFPAMTEEAMALLMESLSSYCTSLQEEIEYAFGVLTSSLSRRTSSGNRARGSSSILVRQSSSPAWSVMIETTSGAREISPPDGEAWLANVRHEVLDRSPIGYPPGSLGWSLVEGIVHRKGMPGLFGDWPGSSVHLPADRTGIVQSYQVIASSIVQRSAGARTRRLDVPTLPGTTADFLSLLLALTQQRSTSEPEERSAIVDLVDEFEQEIGIRVVIDAESGLPGIAAVTPEGRFPVSQTSSMVSELAPILLTARHVLAPNDCLVVDEPEAHLHPALQKLTAQFFAALANRGVRTLLTTHSDFFLGELNNLIRSHAVRPAARAGRRKGLGEAIDPADVAALRFDRKKNGCVATTLPVDPIDGIDESTFGDVMEALYDESIALTDALNESA